MEFKITKEQIEKLARTGNADTERYLQSVFPEAFKKELEVGKWYKHNSTEALVCYQGYGVSYGISNWGDWTNGCFAANAILWRLATKEEVKTALEKETIKRFGEDWKNAKIEECLVHGKPGANKGVFNPCMSLHSNTIWIHNGCIFNKGIWAEPLKKKTPEWTPAPIEKTVIPREKALKILAKKLKVSPENIEIE